MQVITGGARTFSALAYQNQHPDNQNYFARKLTEFSANLTDAGAAFFSDAAAIYDKFNGSEAMQLARAAVRKVKGIWDRDDVRAMTEIDQTQNAKPVMQRWLMANPTVRHVWQEQRCDGFSDTYKDMHPGTIGESHYDYRRVMDGLLVEIKDEDGEDSWMISHYVDELLPGDIPLELEDQLDIGTTWAFVEMYMKAGGRDPVSPYDTKL